MRFLFALLFFIVLVFGDDKSDCLQCPDGFYGQDITVNTTVNDYDRATNTNTYCSFDGTFFDHPTHKIYRWSTNVSVYNGPNSYTATHTDTVLTCVEGVFDCPDGQEVDRSAVPPVCKDKNVCTLPDADYPYDTSTYTVLPHAPTLNSCDLEENTDSANNMCSNAGGVYTVINRSNCCTNSVCLVPISNDSNCPTNSHYSPNNEACICNNGYAISYDLDGTLVCTAPKCPDVYHSLPLFKETDTVEHCNFFEMGDGDALQRPDGVICCYGQESEKNDTCPVDYIEIDGECYKLSPHPDNNDTNNTHDCPTNYYFSFTTNQCEPFYPDNNGSDDDGGGGTDNGGGGSGGSGDGNNSFPDLGLGKGDISPDIYRSGLLGYSDKALGELNKLLNSFILIKLPVNISGSCSHQLKASFTLLSHAYRVDLTSYFAKLDQYNHQIYLLVLFLFGISGVVIVVSGRSE